MKSAYSRETIFVQWAGREKPYPVSPFEQGDSVAMPGQDLKELAIRRMKSAKFYASHKPYRVKEEGMECYVCESEVVIKEVPITILDPRFTFAGSGRVVTERIPCCPNCEDPKSFPKFRYSYSEL